MFPQQINEPLLCCMIRCGGLSEWKRNLLEKVGLGWVVNSGEVLRLSYLLACLSDCLAMEDLINLFKTEEVCVIYNAQS